MNGLPHPPDATMAAFLEGKLAPDDRANVAHHLRGCSECRLVLSETARFEREEESIPAPRAAKPWWMTLAAILAAVAISVPLLLRYAGSDARLIPRMIAAAPEEHRLVEPRLSGFRWARWVPTRGTAPPVDREKLKFHGVAGDVLTRAEKGDSPEAIHARGLALLLVDRPSESIAALEQAARASQDARAWNDLAAARYALAVNGKPSVLPEALSAVDRALRLDPKSAEALFNRALILERMQLRKAARKAWERYLEIDPDSAWSVEARTRLQRLGGNAKAWKPEWFNSMAPEELARQFPQETRTSGEVLLLGEWANAVAAKNDVRAGAAMTRARALADALQRSNGEQLFADAVTAIERADSSQRAALADAHRIYYDGRVLLEEKPAEAEGRLREAALLFARGGSPMAQVARYYTAMAAFGQGRSGEAQATFVQLLATIDAKRHRGLAAQIQRELAVIGNAAGDWGMGTRHAVAGAAIFHDLRESSNEAHQDGVAAMALEMMGERDLAWTRRLRMFSGSTNDREFAAILRSSSWTMAALGFNTAAASLLDLRLDDADRSNAPGLSVAYAEAARLAGKNDDPDRARSALASASAYAAQVSDFALRRNADAHIDLASSWAAADARTSLAPLGRAIAFFAESGQHAVLLDAYVQRARAHRTIGDDAAAAADLAAGLGAVEKQRRTIPAGAWRSQFLDVATQLIEETIELRLSHGDDSGAFDIADRARSLLDVAPLDAPATGVRPQLAPDVALIEYAVLPHSIVAFCVVNGSVTAHRTPIDRADLDARIASFAGRIRSRAATGVVNADAESLHRLLIAPLQQCLAGIREIVFIPDRQLHAVPFAALRNPVTQKYLVEEWTLRFAPSATFRREAASSLAPALVVVDPRTPQSPSLSASRDEGTHIASMHGAPLLADASATRAAFTEGAQRSSLVHFAGHANSDASTSYGALLLAAAGTDTGIISSSEIARLRLERQPLVILAACGTIRGGALHISGMASLSRAFLTAGARGVIGTLWDIEDDVSAPLFVSLHRHLLAGDSPAQALRRAQTELLQSNDPRLAQPGSWAAVEFLGSV